MDTKHTTEQFLQVRESWADRRLLNAELERRGSLIAILLVCSVMGWTFVAVLVYMVACR